MSWLGFHAMLVVVLVTGADAFFLSGGLQRSSLRRIPDRVSPNALCRARQLQAASGAGGLEMKMGIGQGSYVAIVTPMKLGGEVDEDALRGLLRWHLESGTDGIVALGTTGEASLLTNLEREAVLKITMQEVGGKIPVVAGTSSVNPHVVIEQSNEAAKVGCDAVLVATPAYIKPPQEGLVKFFRLVAEKGSLPLVLYNVPGRSAVDMKPETVTQLAGHPNIVGLKEATGDLTRLPALREGCPKDFMLYSGDDGTGMDFVLGGGDGVVSVTADVAPREMSLLMKACLKGARQEAESINSKLGILHEKLFIQSNPIPAKYALSKMGRIANSLRVPLVPLGSQYEGELDDALAITGCLSRADCL